MTSNQLNLNLLKSLHSLPFHKAIHVHIPNDLKSISHASQKKRTLASPDNGSDITDPRIARAETYRGVGSHQFQTL
jgi:hypothetical protein